MKQQFVDAMLGIRERGVDGFVAGNGSRHFLADDVLHGKLSLHARR